MSTKTLRKRIALVAVSALGAGLLSVVAVPSANAAGATPSTGAPASTLFISSSASTTGEGAQSQTLTSAAALSTGFVTKTSTNGSNYGAPSAGYTLASSVAGTAIVVAGAQIAFAAGGSTGSGAGVSVVVTGGTLVKIAAASYDGTTATTISPSVNGAGTTAVAVQALTSSGSLIGLMKVSAAAGTTATLAAYTGTGITDTSTATNGTLIGIWTFTVAAASASGAYATTYSTIAQQVSFTKATTASGNEIWDNTTRIKNGNVAAIWYSLKDAYGAALTTGTLAATSTNSAGTLISGTVGAALPYSATTAFASLAMPADGEGWIIVNQPVANTAGTSTVTITLDGAVLATKTLNWAGDVASITVDEVNSNNIFRNGAAVGTYTDGNGGVIYVVKDAAGNVLDMTGTSQVAISGGTGALVNASVSAATATTYGTLQTPTVGYGYTTMLIPASDLYGAGTYKLKLTNAVGATVYSSVVKATVSNGEVNSFTATWDKASYTPGEIAVLTVTGKDPFGNLIGDGYAATGLAATVAGSQTVGFYGIGSACDAATKVFYGGYFTCKFAANSEGAWSYSVDVTTSPASQSATVGSLKITSGGGVSNADVLKAIVSLIASINKQIAALQKALLKK